MASPPLSDDSSMPPLQRAAFLGNLGRVKRLVQQVENEHKEENIGQVLGKIDGNGFTPLHVAAYCGNTTICKYLIKGLKVNVDVLSRHGTTPLHHAVIGNRHPTAVYLLDNGANVHSTCENRATPLHYAAMAGFEKIMKLLISRDAEVNAMSQFGTPLQMAAHRGKKDCVKMLLDNHADPNAIHYRVYSPLVVAVYAESIECVKILLQAGADPSLRSVKVVPLEAAVMVENTDIIKCLLAAGANPDARNELGLTPLEIAAVEGQHEDVSVLFPATAPIEGITDWSLEGVMAYVRTDEAKKKRKEKTREAFLRSKAKAKAAFESKNYEDAVHYYSECLCFEPSDPGILQERAACWAMLNEGDLARQDIMGCIGNMFSSGNEVTVSIKPVSEEDLKNMVWANGPPEFLSSNS